MASLREHARDDLAASGRTAHLALEIEVADGWFGLWELDAGGLLLCDVRGAGGSYSMGYTEFTDLAMLSSRSGVAAAGQLPSGATAVVVDLNGVRLTPAVHQRLWLAAIARDSDECDFRLVVQPLDERGGSVGLVCERMIRTPPPY